MAANTLSQLHIFQFLTHSLMQHINLGVFNYADFLIFCPIDWLNCTPNLGFKNLPDFLSDLPYWFIWDIWLYLVSCGPPIELFFFQAWSQQMCDVSPQKLVKIADSPIYWPKSIALDGLTRGLMSQARTCMDIYYRKLLDNVGDTLIDWDVPTITWRVW